MKTVKRLFVLIALIHSMGVSYANPPADVSTLQGQEGRGGDNIEPLFIQAQADAAAIAGRSIRRERGTDQSPRRLDGRAMARHAHHQ